jgi:hypothetical protein
MVCKRRNKKKTYNGKFFCQCSYCCSQCKGTKFVKLHDNGISLVPLQTIIIYCPTCFGTGRELTSNERLEFVRKQKQREVEAHENKLVS